MKMSSSFMACFSFAHCRTLATPMSVCNSSANLSWRHLWIFTLDKKTWILPKPYHSFSLESMVFSWSSTTTCSTFQKNLKDSGFHYSSKKGHILNCLTLEKLANANLWVNLRRSHIRGFGWPLWVTVASTRNNLEIIFKQNKDNVEILAEYLSTMSNCSLSEISRVSTWSTHIVQLQKNISIVTSNPKSIIMTMERGEARRSPVRPGEPVQLG